MLEKIKEKSWKVKGGIALAVLIILLSTFFAGGFVIGKLTSGKIDFKVDSAMYKQTPLPQSFDSVLMKQVWSILQEDYVSKDKIDEKEMFYGAMRGFVGGIGDPYTTFMDPDSANDFDDQINGEFGGIGAELIMKDNYPTVVAPLPETPAERAGILPNDKIYEVDGNETTGLSLEKVVRMIRGPKATKVKLLIGRGTEAAKEFEIERDVIKLKSVKWTYKDNIAHIQFSSFNADSMELFGQFLAEAKVKKPVGIILDMRNNPGGLLDVAVDVANLWVANTVVVSEKFGDGRETNYKTEGTSPLKGIKTVVLINEGSASASEIVAGALQDLKVATLIGKKSFGKGSVQVLRKLPDGSSLKVTVAKWLTPLGRSINEEGIMPDVEVNFTKEDADKKKDPQLEKAFEIVKQKEVVKK